MSNEGKKSKKGYETVLLEEIKSQFTAFGEGLGALSEQFEAFKDTQEVLVGKVDKLEVGQKVLTEKVEMLQTDVTEIKHKLSKKVDLEDFQTLEKRVIKLEKLILSKAS